MKRFLLMIAVTGSLVATATAQMNMNGMDGMGAMGDSSTEALMPLKGKAYDIAWLSQMIEHHRGAVSMAQLCVKTCVDKDIKGAAQQIVGDQDKEIKQMTAWLRSWYNATPDPRQMALMKADMKPMMDSSMGNMRPMAGMKHATDRSFLDGMIPHHQHAVDMGKDASKRALRPELRVYAQSVVTGQGAEIKQFKRWLETKKI